MTTTVATTDIQTQPDKPKKKKSKGFHLPKIITPEDIAKILSVPNTATWIGMRNRAILATMHRAGLRVQEVCNLTLQDVDISRPELGTIFVQQSKNNKDRRIPIDAELVSWLRKWAEIRGKKSNSKNKGKEDNSKGENLEVVARGDYFFCTYKGEQLDQRYIRDMCYRYSREAGVMVRDSSKDENKNTTTRLRPVNPHLFRHSCATEMLKSGFTIYEVMMFLGHEDIKTTEKYLIYNMEDVAKKMRERGMTGA
jgi:site-specific recombinase XerD